MKLDNILGKIISLTKEVKFAEPEEGFDLSSSFLTGGMNALSPFGNLGLQWWYTQKATRLLNDIAKMAMIYDPKLKNGDREEFVSTIRNTLEQNVLRCGIFDGDDVFLRRVNCLFDARVDKNTKEFSSNVWALVSSVLSDSITNWLLLYPLQNIDSPSYNLGFNGISILNSKDQVLWDLMTDKYTEAKSFDPGSGDTKNGKLLLISEKRTKVWIICEINGTQTGARENAGRLIRQFLAVLFSYLSKTNPHVLQQSMANPETRSMQFPMSPNAVGYGWSSASIGELLPPLLNELHISTQDLEYVKLWHEKHKFAEGSLAHRASKSAHFIQYASTSKDIDKFIYYFIALDALFGERNRVETNIKEGLKKSFNDINWVTRAECLFDLRNELMHGGSSYVEEWKGLEHYENHYNSDPMRDVQLAALTSLRSFFD